DAARRLHQAGRAPFTRADLIAEVHTVDATRARNRIDPVIQGMTANAPGGARSGCGEVFERVSRGRYVLTPSATQPGMRPAPQTPTRAPSAAPTGRSARVRGRLQDLAGAFDTWVATYDRTMPATGGR